MTKSKCYITVFNKQRENTW